MNILNNNYIMSLIILVSGSAHAMRLSKPVGKCIYYNDKLTQAHNLAQVHNRINNQRLFYSTNRDYDKNIYAIVQFKNKVNQYILVNEVNKMIEEKNKQQKCIKVLDNIALGGISLVGSTAGLAFLSNGTATTQLFMAIGGSVSIMASLLSLQPRRNIKSLEKSIEQTGSDMAELLNESRKFNK